MTKKKIWFFRYDTWQHNHIYLPHTWYEFKRYYELNGKHSTEWEWIPPVIDYDQWSIDEIVNEAITHKADVYMFSSYMWSWEIVKVAASAIKDHLPNSLIILGGPHQHTTYTQPMIWFKNHPYVDAVARPAEYGEFFITDMLDAVVENKLDWNNIRGSYHRKGFGPEGNKTEFNYPTEIIRSNIDHARLVSSVAKDKQKKLGIMYETNRGCMYKCVYCEWGGGTSTKVISKNLENIYEDMSHFRDLNVQVLWITDANFGIMKRDPEIAEFISSQNDYLKFVGITGLAKTKSEKRAAVLEPLMRSGLVNIYQVSLQTIDDSILENIIRTDVTPEENISLAKYLIKKYDIDVIVELILGMPGMKLETFYKETALEYSLLNKVKHVTHHVPLYVLPDAPVANPEYLRKFGMKLAPIAIEDSINLLQDSNSKYIENYKSKNYKKENTLYIPISADSYSVKDWKEMFFMNDMNHILMNMAMITPFVDYLHYHRKIPLDFIFKSIFISLSEVDSVYKEVCENYLDPLSAGEYWNKSWRQFEVGPIKGLWTVYSSYAYLWCEHKSEIYNRIRKNFKPFIDEIVEDCLTYCEHSTLGTKEDVVWENLWRWDLWEESGGKDNTLNKGQIQFINIPDNIDWIHQTTIYRNKFTFRLTDRSPIKMKLFSLEKNKETQ
jgi:tRNA A37 methylthiotransferase MiaB